MKIRLGDLRGMTEGLYKLNKKRFPVKIGYAITRNIETLEKEYAAFERQRIELCKTYADKDEKGNPIVKDKAYRISNDKILDFNNEFLELANGEVDIDIRMVSVEEFDKCEIAERYDIPTGDDFSILNFMLEG